MQAGRTRILLAAILTALVLAACGGSSHPSQSAAGGQSPKGFTAADMEKYPRCMRAHGVGNFPDPQVSGNSVRLTINPSITGSPAYNSARSACAYLLPAGNQMDSSSPAQRQAHRAGLLAFAACVRRHGFPTFPDPNNQGQVTRAMISQAGINLKQPAVQRVGDDCVPASRGQITRGDVARAIAQAGSS